jgi:hypothetical protein
VSWRHLLETAMADHESTVAAMDTTSQTA